MCAPEFNIIEVPTPIIINGIPFDEDLIDPLDIFNEDIAEFADFEDFDDANSDFLALYVSDSDSSTDYDQFRYPDFEESDDLDDEFSNADSDFQTLLDDYLLVTHDILRSYDATSASDYSRWIYENMSDFPADLDEFINVQLGIIVDILVQSA